MRNLARLLILLGLIVVIAAAAPLLFMKSGGIGLAAVNVGPVMSIPSNIASSANSVVSVPVSFTANGSSVASIVFSIDYDQTYLTFDPALANAVVFNLPVEFTGSCSPDMADLDGELDCFIFDPMPPLAAMPDRVIVTFKLRTGDPVSPVTAAVNFSTNSPPASFGSILGQSISGSVVNGSVSIDGGSPGGGDVYLPLVFKALLPTFTPTPTMTLVPSKTSTPTQTPTGVVPPTRTPTPTPTKTKTPTITPTSGCFNIVDNHNFEGVEAWVFPITVYSASYSLDQAHSPVRSARTGIIDPAQNLESYSSVRQRVTIPADTNSATLVFWYYPLSTEPLYLPLAPIPAGSEFGESPLAYDTQYAHVLNSSGTYVETLFWARENTKTWTYKEIDITKYKGQTIYLSFGSYNDGYGGITAMYVDDVFLNICR